MPSLLSTLLTAEERQAHEDRLYEEILAVYHILTPEELGALPGLIPSPSDSAVDVIAERLALRDRMTYTQARYCRLNILSKTEYVAGQWMTVAEAAGACHVFGIRRDDYELVEEAIDRNWLPLHNFDGQPLVEVAEFETWQADLRRRLQASRPVDDYAAFQWVRGAA